jgi:UDP-N-acetylmuramate--alanine ligase
MSGIAELLANLGYRVSGSDVKRSDTTDRLSALGVEISVGHRAENVTTCTFTSLPGAHSPRVAASL